MTVETFFNENLDTIKMLIAKELGDKFDSHDFIRCFSKKFEVEYVKFLKQYEDHPFKNVHLQIGKCLQKRAEDLKIQKNIKAPSSNVFGNETENQQWLKLN